MMKDRVSFVKELWGSLLFLLYCTNNLRWEDGKEALERVFCSADDGVG